MPGDDVWRLTGLYTFESSTIDADVLQSDGSVHDAMKNLLESLSTIALAKPENVWITNAFSSVARMRRAGSSVSATYMSYQIDITTPMDAMMNTVEANIAKTFVDMRTANGAFQLGNGKSDVTFISGSVPGIVKGAISTSVENGGSENQFESTADEASGNANVNVSPIVGGIVALLILSVVSVYLYRRTHDESSTVGPGKFGKAGSVRNSKTVTNVNNAMFGFGSSQKKEEVKVRKDSVKKSVQRSFKKNENMQPSKDVLSVARSQENEAKNRFKHMLPYNHNRVLLDESGQSETDYINASYVPRYDERTSYIVCQSPLENTLVDFVEMIWQKEVEVIVMLTDQENAVPYFDDIGKPIRFGELSITQLKMSVRSADYEISTLRITHGKSGQKRLIKHCQYLTWPASEVPDTPGPFAAFRTRVTEAQAEMRKANKASVGDKPIVVHDASGCGQSACFVCMDRELERFDGEGVVDIFESVSELRKSRAYMVLSPEQYLFIHQTIFHSLMHNPFTPPEELPLDVQHFVKHYTCPAKFKGFDLGANGRKFLSMGHFSLVGRAKGRQASKEVVVVVCNDVVLVCEEGEDRQYHMLSAPINREVIGAVDVQHSWDEPLFMVSSQRAQYVLEADTMYEKMAWIELINKNPNYIPTEELQGPRLVRLDVKTRSDVSSITGLLNPFDSKASKELTNEFSIIPRTGVLDEKYLEISEGAPAKSGKIELIPRGAPDQDDAPQEISFFEYRRRDSVKAIGGNDDDDVDVDEDGGVDVDVDVEGTTSPTGRRTSYEMYVEEQKQTGFDVVKFKAPNRSGPTSPKIAVAEEEEETFDNPEFGGEEEEEEEFDNPEFDEGNTGVAETSFSIAAQQPAEAPVVANGPSAHGFESFQMTRVRKPSTEQGYLDIGGSDNSIPTSPMSAVSMGRRTSQFSETLLGQSSYGHEILDDAADTEARRKASLAAAYGMSTAPSLSAQYSATLLGQSTYGHESLHEEV